MVEMKGVEFKLAMTVRTASNWFTPFAVASSLEVLLCRMEGPHLFFRGLFLTSTPSFESSGSESALPCTSDELVNVCGKLSA